MRPLDAFDSPDREAPRFIVSDQQVTATRRAGAGTTFVADASDLGVPPGGAPQRIAAPDIGNGCDFVLTRVDPDGTLCYAQEHGCCELRVLND